MSAIPPARWRRQNEAVYYTDSPLSGLDDESISFLQRTLPATPRQRIRVCTHPDIESPFQEMMIALGKNGYVRPHRHHGKVESLHVISGRARLLLFDESGRLEQHVPLGGGPSECWYFRIDQPVFHTLLPQSKAFVFHESTTGPLRADATEYADWAPHEDQTDSAQRYVAQLSDQIRTRPD